MLVACPTANSTTSSTTNNNSNVSTTTTFSSHCCFPLQVRCFMGDNEQRWYMWYSGSSAPMEGLAGVAAAAGSIGETQQGSGCHTACSLHHCPPQLLGGGQWCNSLESLQQPRKPPGCTVYLQLTHTSLVQL